MTDKKLVKDFIVAIANDDYVAADKIFPKVVDSATKNLINNKKPDIVKKLSEDAEKIAISSVTDQNKKE